MNNILKRTVAIIDDQGIPSFMVKFENTAKTAKEADRVFFVRGQEYDAFYMSAFPNVVINGRAYSLPLMTPTTRLTLDEMIAACRKKGDGWHVATAAEWFHMVEESRQAGTMPHGNTNNGKFYYDANERGIPGNIYGTTLTGSGPATWRHDGTFDGVSDANGDVWKRLTGIRLKNGIFQYIPDNDAAHPEADLSEDSAEYKDVQVSGKPVRIGMMDGEVCITTDEDIDGWAVSCRKEVINLLPETPEILRRLGIVTPDQEESNEWLVADADLDEATPFVGASWSYTSHAGSSALYLYDRRSLVYSFIGFFSAFLGEPVIR